MDKTEDTAALLRRAMRRLASGVVLVTAIDESGTPHGMAASSATPVSMAPPSMLVAINRDASIHPVLARTKLCCLNLLGPGQSSLLEPFSSSAQRDRRFISSDWHREPGIAPYLPTAPAAVFCELERFIDYGTHTICIGAVKRVVLGPSAEPLIWLDGSWHLARRNDAEVPTNQLSKPASTDAHNGDFA